MSAPLNFAVVGCGALARQMHVPNLAASKKAVLHTCCDLSDDALRDCVETHGALHTSKDWQATLRNPEIDAICLATTEKLRLPVIALAAELGKPIYVEKPVATSLEEAYEIQKVVNAAGIPLCVGHNRRSSPAIIEARRVFRKHMESPQPCSWRWNREGDDRPPLADDGVAQFVGRINDDWYSWKSWVFDKQQAPHGPMLFEMTHFTDLCNWFLDAEPEEVIAMETGMLNHAIIIRYKTGELATLSLCGNGTFGYPKELYEMMGNGGIVVVDHMCEIRTAGIEGAEPKTIFPLLKDNHPETGGEGGISGWLAKKRAGCAQVLESGNPMDQFAAEPDKGHMHALENFIDQINGDGPEVCGINDAVLATRVAFAAIRSAAEHRPVSLDEI